MTAAFADDETWHVLMSADDMKRMNVDQLGDAFRLSLIDASTLVWQAGMEGWRRLGSVADVEDEDEIDVDELIESWTPPAAPRPVTYASPTVTYAPAHAPPVQTYAPVHAPPIQTYAPVYPSPTQSYATAMPAVDSYLLAQRRAELPDTVDFRRAPGSVRWGRWLVAMLLVTGGVLGAYRQNLLRHGARSIGVESTYLASEQRVTAFVSAKAPTAVKGVLKSLALLPGPNAGQRPAALLESTMTTASPLMPSPTPVTPTSAVPAAAPPCVAVVKEPEKSAEVRTVSFDSLPVLRRGSGNAKPLAASQASSAEKADRAPRASKKNARREAREPIARAAPKPKAKRRARAAPPPADDNPLRAAMRKVVASDARKLTAR